MKTQIKQQWLSALRSGEYTQARWNLQTEQGFCCLGVLCDLYAKETGTEWEVTTTEDDEPFTYYNFDEHSNHLPVSVMKWADLDCDNPVVKGELSLAELNDGGFTFEEIAQLIEEKF
jgi:hypothetical protein